MMQLRESPAGAAVASAMRAPEGMPRVLYITFDGLLQPLGRSQVVTYLIGLSNLGFRFSVLSLEQTTSELPIKQMREQLSAAGIVWDCLPYRTGGVRAVRENMVEARRVATKITERDDIGLVHARSYLAADVARSLYRKRRIPYLFDMRGYWIDERAEERRWGFQYAPVRGIGKRWERSLIRDAAAVVTLTSLQAADIAKIVPDGTPVRVIPTCCDYDVFSFHTAPESVAAADAEALRGKLVLGYVGSINASYRLDAVFRLFQMVFELRPDARLLCLTQQKDRALELLKDSGIPAGVSIVRTVEPDQVAHWLPLIHWGFLLMNTSFAKRGSMPTKLAEFFAAGVRPIQFGGNEEIARLVAEAQSGIVLRDLDERTLREAARRIAAEDPAVGVDTARNKTREYFGLEAGVASYAQLFQAVHARQSGRAVS